MKVGILTWYDVLNYGSAFQAYALQQQIRRLGYDAEILKNDRTNPDYFSNMLMDKSLIGVLKWFRNQTPNRAKYRSLTKSKYQKFFEFKNEYLNINNHALKNDDDCVIIGSDQVFDINAFYHPWQFGKGVDCDCVSTYAPSFGETTLQKLKNSNYYDEIKGSIINLNNLNARDQNTKEILEKITDKQIEIVLDPVLLYDFKDEKELWNKPLISGKYCLVYTWGGNSVTKEFANKCRDFATKNSLKLVSVGEIRNWCDIQFADASPIEFFELFMYADVVLTNMFHGTCFSLLMNKPFYSFVMPHNENKLYGLLKFLNLEKQAILSIDELPNDIPQINYCDVNKLVADKREKSFKELNKCLHFN